MKQAWKRKKKGKNCQTKKQQVKKCEKNIKEIIKLQKAS